jgi:predicted acylesterase/phospholipase RssA
MQMDLILSSGFLAFGRHAGFLAAIEDHDIDVGALVGTSSGALTGSLWAAGHPADKVLEILSDKRPLDWLRLHTSPWRGLFELDNLIEGLRDHLPARFEDLERPFAVGVVDPGNKHRLIDSGPLPEAVAASCAIPYIFTAVELMGTQWRDGAGADRTAVDAWRSWRPGRDAIVHLIKRTRGARKPFDPGNLTVIRTPPSGAQLWGLGAIHQRFEISKHAVLDTLGRLTAPVLPVHGGMRSIEGGV